MATATATTKIDAALERAATAESEYEDALETARTVGADARQADEDALELEALAEMGKSTSKDAAKARTAAEKAAKKARIAAAVVDLHQKALDAAERDVRELREQAEADRIADRHAAVRELTKQFADLVVGAEKALLALEVVYDELQSDQQPYPHRKLHMPMAGLVYDSPQHGGIYATFLEELDEFGYEVDR